MKRAFILAYLLLLSCSGGSGTSYAPAPAVQSPPPSNFAGQWAAQSDFYRSSLTLATTDDVNYSGTITIVDIASALTMTADVTGQLSWGQRSSICSGPSDWNWMILNFSNIQGNIVSPTETVLAGDAVLKDHSGYTLIQLPIGLTLSSGTMCMSISWFQRK